MHGRAAGCVEATLEAGTEEDSRPAILGTMALTSSEA